MLLLSMDVDWSGTDSLILRKPSRISQVLLILMLRMQFTGTTEHVASEIWVKCKNHSRISIEPSVLTLRIQ